MDKDNKVSSKSNDSDAPISTSGSFGEQLQQARLRRGLSHSDVAKELFILERHIEALEAESFTELPQMAFARGFVVNYAKFLGLDATQLEENFNRSYPDELKRKSPADVKSPLRPMGTLQRESGRTWRINPLLVIGLIALIILAVFLLRTVTNAQNSTGDNDNTATVADDLSDNEQLAGAAISSPSVTATPGLTSTGSALDLGATGSTVNTPDAASNLPTQQANLEFWVTNNTDLNVVDATGKSLLSGSQSRGAYNLTGMAPFKITIDDVSKVSLNLNKQPIKLSDYAQDNKANFTLAP